MSKKFFSIVLPVYNVENYLEECLTSIVNQTCQDFELIAINDGSTDCSLDILNNFKNDFLYDMKIIDQNNMGLSGARNSAIEFLNSEYTYFLDSDDFLEIDTLSVLKDNLLVDKVDLIKFDAVSFSDEDFGYKFNKMEYDRSKIFKENYVYSKKEFLELNRKNFLAPVWLYCVKTSVILNHKLKFENKLIHEDELFTPILFINCKSFMYVNRKFFNRRYRSNSIMTTEKNKERSIINYLLVCKLLNEYCEKSKEILKNNELLFIEDRISNLTYIMHSIDLTNEYINKKFNFTKLSAIQKIKINIKRKKNEFAKI